jgi:hypothetical protein
MEPWSQELKVWFPDLPVKLIDESSPGAVARTTKGKVYVVADTDLEVPTLRARSPSSSRITLRGALTAAAIG